MTAGLADELMYHILLGLEDTNAGAEISVFCTRVISKQVLDAPESRVRPKASAGSHRMNTSAVKGS